MHAYGRSSGAAAPLGICASPLLLITLCNAMRKKVHVSCTVRRFVYLLHLCQHVVAHTTCKKTRD